jgi:hypothetical protein
MSTIHVKAQLSPDELVKAVAQMSTAELDQFAARVIALRAERHGPRLPAREADLLRQINQGLPEELLRRYEELVAKRQGETLTPEEHVDLLRLSGQVEELERRRLEALVELAQQRQMPMGTLLQQLGIPAPGDGA